MNQFSQAEVSVFLVFLMIATVQMLLKSSQKTGSLGTQKTSHLLKNQLVSLAIMDIYFRMLRLAFSSKHHCALSSWQKLFSEENNPRAVETSSLIIAFTPLIPLRNI